MQTKMKELPTRSTQVLIIGGGISGYWTAYKLAQLNIQSIIVDYVETDRGGRLGSTQKSVGAINLSAIEHPDFEALMDDIGEGQVHPDVTELLKAHLAEELVAIQKIADFKKIKLGIALKDSSARNLIETLKRLYLKLGGRIINGWAIKLHANQYHCNGIQYQMDDAVGIISAPAVVIASGGYAGLFSGSIKTGNYGSFLGRYLQEGGLANNLEFLFKHGYGKPDLCSLTPTEELPGVEVYDDQGTHVSWLEEELFKGQGTNNHLQAFKHWRRNSDNNYYIDARYKVIYTPVADYNRAIATETETQTTATAKTQVPASALSLNTCLRPLLEICNEAQLPTLLAFIEDYSNHPRTITYAQFNDLKILFSEKTQVDKFRVRQISYFSMGGIAHANFKTNLSNVYVTGEAMHDFGAHRVGGLPWALYLVSGKVIAEDIFKRLKSGHLHTELNKTIEPFKSSYDPVLMQTLQKELTECQENNLSHENGKRFIRWVQQERGKLVAAKRTYDDAFAWLIVAEAIVSASLLREESRGCFYRNDFPESSPQFQHKFTLSYYDFEKDIVYSDLISAHAMSTYLLPQEGVIQYA